MWITAPNISCLHGFSLRHGGVSPAPYSSLNLGGSEDSPENISANRLIALRELGIGNKPLSLLKQVHGSEVCIAKNGITEADAQVSNNESLTLTVSVADCYPILFHDPLHQVIGAAHAGWRGTCDRIAAHTVSEMEQLGARLSEIKVAIGPGISFQKFEVGPEVIEKFRSAGFPSNCYTSTHVDLVACNRYLLIARGIQENNIWTLNRCSYEEDFFSFRRDEGKTGRMWAVISLGKN